MADAMDPTTKKLLSTTDAMVWAEEFCRDRYLRDRDGIVLGRPDFEGLMVGWFANAMCAAADAERRKIAESIVGYPITIDVDRLGDGPPPRPTVDGGEAILLADEVHWGGKVSDE